MVKLLMGRGADPSFKGRVGRMETILTYATKMQMSEISLRSMDIILGPGRVGISISDGLGLWSICIASSI